MTGRQGIIARILRRHSSTARQRGRVLRHFAKKIGLVYFGAVDQHQDEHEVIRGLTASTTHRDEHYAVGSYDGYDISIVDRFDITLALDGKASHHNWVIFRINLDSDERLPHLFLSPLGHAPAAYTRFFNAYSHLSPLNPQFTQDHSAEFHRRYEVYGASTHLTTVEALLTPAVTQMIATQLWPHAVELFDNQLYLYLTETDISENGLAALLETGLWVARVLDHQE